MRTALLFPIKLCGLVLFLYVTAGWLIVTPAQIIGAF